MARKKINKISKIQEIANSIAYESGMIEWNGIEITIKTELNMNECIEFEKIASENCFSELGEYLPEMLEFTVGIATVLTYTDLELPDNIEDKYKIIMCTDLVDSIAAYINKEQYGRLMSCLDERIEYKITSHIDTIRRQVDELYLNAESLFSRISEIFEGINPEDLRTMISAVGANGVDEEKILKAYLSQKK